MAQEFKPAYPCNGVIDAPIDPRDYTIFVLATAFLKRIFQPKRPIKRQKVNRCVAEVLRIPHYRQTGEENGANYGYARWREGYLGQGMLIREALDGLAKYGIPLLKDDPYEYEMPEARDRILPELGKWDRLAAPRKGCQYARLTSPAEVKATLKEAVENPKLGITIAAAVAVYGFEVDQYGWYSCHGDGYPIGSHLIEVTGYDDERVYDKAGNVRPGAEIANSWGIEWGDNGYAWVTWDDIFAKDSVFAITPLKLPENNIKVRRSLRKGMKGDDVKELQTKLSKHGFTLKADGIFGSGTEKKVKAFQTARKLVADGIVGKKSWAELDKEPPAKPSSEHFSLDEFACHDGTPVPPELYGNVQALMDALENIRKAFGNKPVKIVSGYRTLAYNRKIGNDTDNSQHIQANAADIRISGVSAANVYKILDVMYPNQGLGKYATFTHIDLRGKRARW
jgi:peptidoglycan hydrolase-like protein with peptidoglycan-binding domain